MATKPPTRQVSSIIWATPSGSISAISLEIRPHHFDQDAQCLVRLRRGPWLPQGCSAGDRGSALEEHGPIATEFLEEKHLGITWFILVQQSTFILRHNNGIIYSRNNQNYTKLFLSCASKVCRQNWTWKTMFEMWASFRELFLFV